MKSTTSLAAITGLVASASAQYFAGISARSASPIHLLPITASGQQLWLGGTTAAYCPDNVKELGGCPAGNFTNFAGGQNTLSMGSVVPGGQQVYIEPSCGAVKYTQAHSAAQPDGSIDDGWSLVQGESFGTLSWKDGLVACNVSGSAPYPIYAQVEGVNLGGDCLGFSFLTTNSTLPAAWQYS